jgi:hypothetical protein
MNRDLGLICLLAFAGCGTSRVMAWNNSRIEKTVRIQAASTSWEGVIAPASVACFAFEPRGDGGFVVAITRADGTTNELKDVDYFTESIHQVHLLEFTENDDVIPRVYAHYGDRLQCRQ